MPGYLVSNSLFNFFLRMLSLPFHFIAIFHIKGKHFNTGTDIDGRQNNQEKAEEPPAVCLHSIDGEIGK